VKVDDRCVAWVRTLIDGRVEEGQRLAEELDADGAADPLVPLLYYSFVFAMRRLFEDTYSTGTYTKGAVIRLVARVRARIAGKGVVLDPEAAESEILHALGDKEASRSPDGDARSLVHVALLKFAVQDADLDKAQVDELLARARQSVADGLPDRARGGDDGGH
jgi:hypothetical protein